MGFPRQERWSGLPFPSPGDLPDPGANPGLLHWQAGSLPLSHLGSLDGPSGREFSFYFCYCFISVVLRDTFYSTRAKHRICSALYDMAFSLGFTLNAKEEVNNDLTDRWHIPKSILPAPFHHQLRKPPDWRYRVRRARSLWVKLYEGAPSGECSPGLFPPLVKKLT